MSFWPTKEHWSVEIPLRTDHYLGSPHWRRPASSR